MYVSDAEKEERSPYTPVRFLELVYLKPDVTFIYCPNITILLPKATNKT